MAGRYSKTSWISALVLFCAFQAGADFVDTTINVGSAPLGIAIDTVTNKIYVANFSGKSFTVINGVTNFAATTAAGTNPDDVAVNPATDKVYISNNGGGNVTIIDDSTNTTAMVSVGQNPVGVAVNPVTNTIYVANAKSGNVTVITGVTDSTATIALGGTPSGIAVNTVTNKIYVANYTAGSVKVIDGTNIANTTVVNTGTQPKAIAVNMVTNMIYVTNVGSGNVTVINGTHNTVAATVNTGTEPCAIAVNPVTNKIYVANETSNNVTMIDGATDTTATINAGTEPDAITVNPATNKIYVANYESNNVTVINGVTNSTTTLAVGSYPEAIAVNNATNKIYVSNDGSNNVTVIDGGIDNIALIYPAHNATAVALTPTFKWSAATNATAYTMQISVNTAFSSFGNILNTGVTSDSLSFGLPTANRKYYWRVAGTHGSNTGAWTADSFTTGQFVPAVPTLSAPTNGATNVALTTTLSWNHAAGDTSYRMQVSSSLSFSNPNDTALAATARVIKLASSTALYYWRVEASNTYGTSLWSSVWSFTANSTGTIPDRPHYSGVTMGYAGILAVYSLNGKQVLKIPFDAATTKEAVLRRAARIPATGVYKYCFLRDRKVMDGGSFMAK